MFWQNIYKIIVALFLAVDVYVLIFLKINPDSLPPVWKQEETGTTELYFANHTLLPKIVDLETNYSFQFTTANKEKKDISYTYEVLLLENNSTSILERGNFYLKDGEQKTIPVNFVLNEGFDKAKIVVFLANKNQQISFWTKESS